jgi:hypothetical protein
MDEALHDLQELPREQAEHCLDPLFACEIKFPLDPTKPSLPYLDLGPRGLERLCFQLLVQQGAIPRFFGRPGQAQYGIDLVAETTGQRRVYQCKNLDHEPKIGEIREATEKFHATGSERPICPPLTNSSTAARSPSMTAMRTGTSLSSRRSSNARPAAWA